MDKKKWKVLIADDEPKVCRLIRYLVPWEELGLELAAVAANGIEAIEVLKGEEIDIVITDARMPECDGIELIKWCHQQKKELKYIVISGYRHFEYAHGALQYGVDDYLLKPVNQKELVKSLGEIVKKLEQEEAVCRNDREVQRQLDQDRDKLRRHFIGSYIFDGQQFCDKEIVSREEINEEYKMLFAEGIYRALLIKVDNVENADYKIDKLLTKIRDMTEEQLRDFGNESIGTLLHSGVLLLLNYQAEQEELFLKKVEHLYEEAEKIMDIFEGLKLTFGISCRENSIKGISKCVKTAGHAVQYRIRLTNKAIILYDNYEYETVQTEQILTEERQKLLGMYLRNGNRDGVKKLLFDCRLEFNRRKEISPVAVYQVFHEACRLAMDVISSELPETEPVKDMFRDYNERVDRAIKEDMLWKYLEELLQQCVEVLGTELKMKQTRPIRQIREYIEQHYAEPITLELAADKVNLSANYISAMFRKETGVTFSDFLTAKRMEKAVELLRKTDLSIEEISGRVGYADVKYFSKLCKKMLGMKPSEYRKLYS